MRFRISVQIVIGIGFTFGELRFVPVRICFDVVTNYAEQGVFPAVWWQAAPDVSQAACITYLTQRRNDAMIMLYFP